MNKNKKLLIVEDEEMLSDMYAERFGFEGFEIILANDGEKGVEMALKERPDLIILDILLPKKEGVDVLKEIRESGEWGEHIPIIMLTNLDCNDYVLDAIEKYSPSYYFIKSNIELKEVVNKVHELLGTAS